MTPSKELRELLESINPADTLIVCMGNSLKGDDGVGPLIYEQLLGKIKAGLINAATVPENYIEKIIKTAPNHLIIIDAVDFSAKPGSIKLFTDKEMPSIALSTHVLSPKVFVDLIKSRIEVQVYFLAVQPLQVQLKEGLSPQVKDSTGNLIRALQVNL